MTTANIHCMDCGHPVMADHRPGPFLCAICRVIREAPARDRPLLRQVLYAEPPE